MIKFYTFFSLSRKCFSFLRLRPQITPTPDPLVLLPSANRHATVDMVELPDLVEDRGQEECYNDIVNWSGYS